MRGGRFAVAGVLFTAGVAMVIAQQRQPGGFGGGFGGGPASLVVNKAVQEDIKATEEQVEKIKTWSKEYAAKQMEGAKERFAGLKDLSDEERTKKFAEMNAESTKEAYKQLGEVLKAEQIKRVKQIDIQNAGVRAFTRTEVVEALKLTDDQKSTIKGISDEFAKESREIRTEAGFGGGKGGGKGGKGGGFDATKMADMNKKIAKVQKEAIEKISEKLTADQVKTWKELTGDAFDTSKLQIGGGGFGGFGGNKKKDVE
jgi:hypothetical protein